MLDRIPSLNSQAAPGTILRGKLLPRPIGKLSSNFWSREHIYSWIPSPMHTIWSQMNHYHIYIIIVKTWRLLELVTLNHPNPFKHHVAKFCSRLWNIAYTAACRSLGGPTINAHPSRTLDAKPGQEIPCTALHGVDHAKPGRRSGGKLWGTLGKQKHRQYQKLLRMC